MLEKRVLDTLRFFVLQGVPLTLFELHKYLVTESDTLKAYVDSKYEFNQALPEPVPVAIEVVVGVVQQLQSQGKVVGRYGLYTLTHQTALLEQRWRGHKYGAARERLIRRYSWMFRHVPFIRGVALAGSQAQGLEKQGSDIDLFILTSPNFLWIARTAVTVALQLFGIRRHDMKVSNRFCLNHYVAGPRTLKEKNLYTALEYGKLRPLAYGQNIKAFQKENAAWIRACFPNIGFAVALSEQRSVLQWLLEMIFRNPIGTYIEQKLGSVQQKRIHTDEFVVVRDDELSFHPNSKQEKLLREFFA